MFQKPFPLSRVIFDFILLVLSLFFLIYLMPLLPFVTQAYQRYLQIAIVCALGSTSAKILKTSLKPLWLNHFFALVEQLIALINLSFLVAIFPFNFQYPIPLNHIVRFALSIAVFGVAVAFAIGLFKLIKLLSIPDK